MQDGTRCKIIKQALFLFRSFVAIFEVNLEYKTALAAK